MTGTPSRWVKVTLTASQIRKAKEFEAKARTQVEARNAKETPYNGANTDLIAAMAFVALGVYLDVLLPEPSAFRSNRIQYEDRAIYVRGSRHRGGSLLFYPTKDASRPEPTDLAVLGCCPGEEGVVYLAGWTSFQEGMMADYWRTPNDGKNPPIKGNCWMVGQHRLRPMYQLLPNPPLPTLQPGLAI